MWRLKWRIRAFLKNVRFHFGGLLSVMRGEYGCPDDIPKEDNPFLHDAISQGMVIWNDQKYPIYAMWGGTLGGYRNLMLVNANTGKRYEIIIHKDEK